MSLQSILPRPKVLAIGGSSYRFSPLRLRDLAELEAVAAALEPDVIGDALPAIRSTPEGPKRDQLLKSCWLAIEASMGRSSYGGDGFFELLYDLTISQVLLKLVLAPCHPDLTDADIQAIATSGDCEGYERLLWFALGIEPLDQLIRFVDLPTPPSPGEGPTWCEMFCDLAERFSWLNIEAFGDLTLNQFLGLRSGGKSVPGSCRHPKGSAGFFESAKRRARLFCPEPAVEPMAEKPIKIRKPRKSSKPTIDPEPTLPKSSTPRKTRKPRKDK